MATRQMSASRERHAALPMAEPPIPQDSLARSRLRSFRYGESTNRPPTNTPSDSQNMLAAQETSASEREESRAASTSEEFGSGAATHASEESAGAESYHGTTPEGESEPLQLTVGIPISPDMCRSRRPFMHVPSVSVTLDPGPVTMDGHVYIGEETARLRWLVKVHPDGSLYLHNSEHHAVVEYQGSEQEMDDYIMFLTPKLLAMRMYLVEKYPDEHADLELFLRADTDSGDVFYYIADWGRRTVFWEHQHTIERPFSSVSQLLYMLEFQFWEHVERFPSHRALPKGAWDELKSLLTYQVIDASTNSLSTAPYCATDATLFLRALEGRRAESRYVDEALNASVARLWGEQCKVRCHHLYGAAQVRIERTERRGMNEQEPPRRSLQLIGLLLLFNEPHSFYQSLTEVFVDEVMYERFWKVLYHETLREEWKDHAVMATVSLAANMAFLTVGNVGGEGSGNDALSPTSQMLSLISTMLSIGSIVIGKSLPNFHRRLQRCSAIEATDYMTSFSKRNRDGLYKLAMLFSLPFALFMWSLALFVAALLSFAFERWMWGTGMPIALVSAGILAVLMFSLLFLRREGAHILILSNGKSKDSQDESSIWRRVGALSFLIKERMKHTVHFGLGCGNQRVGSPQSERTFVDQRVPPQDHQMEVLPSPTDGQRLSADHRLEDPTSLTDDRRRSVEQMV